MPQPAAKMGDMITALDVHIILIPAAAGAPVPTPLPLPFSGAITGAVSPNVFINGSPAALVGSMADNTPPHIPPGGSFSIPPTNKGIIIMGSVTVLINGTPAARIGDPATTCNDIGIVGGASIVGVSTVFIGG